MSNADNVGQQADLVLAADGRFDPEDIAIAAARDHEIESGAVQPLTDEQFRRRTSGVND